MCSSLTLSSPRIDPPPIPRLAKSSDIGTEGCAATAATTFGSMISGMTNAPVRHMPIAPTLPPPFVSLICDASALIHAVTGADTPARRFANSREMQSRKALRTGARSPSGPNSHGM